MVAIINYGVGNLSSIQNMFKKVGVPAVITADLEEISKAEKILLPGVGSFDHGMSKLTQSGLLPTLEKKALVERVPVLGICLGMQMLTRSSEEGTLPGLGWVDAVTKRFRTDLKIPHMGWNTLEIKDSSSVFKDMDPTESRFYFVHSYHVVCNHEADILAQTSYGCCFTSSLNKDNIFGTQFHPEKSHKFGMKLLKNFGDL